MKILKTKTGSQDRVYSDALIKEINETQNRERLTGRELDGMIALGVARQLAYDAGDCLTRFSKKRKFYHLIRCAEGMLKKATIMAANSVNADQLITMSNNVNDTDVIISSNPVFDSVKPMLNVRRDMFAHVVNQASKECSMSCSCTREESKMCQLRAAFDSLPGIKKLARAGWNLDNGCPYQTFEMEEEE